MKSSKPALPPKARKPKRVLKSHLTPSKGRIPRPGSIAAPPEPETQELEIIVGLNPVLAALTARGGALGQLWVARSLSPANLAVVEAAKAQGLTVLEVDKTKIDPYGPHHQGLALFVAAKAEPRFDKWLSGLGSSSPALVLALDHLQDPHNLGALMRSAAAFGAQGVLATKDRSAPLTQAARAASAGGSEVVPLVTVTNLVRALTELKKAGFWLVGAEGGQGSSLEGFEFPHRCVIILGAEGQGISRIVAKQADFLVHIPLAPGPVNSLNVSNAGAIFMYAYACELGKAKKGPN